MSVPLLTACYPGNPSKPLSATTLDLVDGITRGDELAWTVKILSLGMRCF